MVIADTAGKWPYSEERTADFMYVRLRGGTKLYTSGYSNKELATWAKLIRRGPRDAYVYFDNDRKVRAPFDAMRLAEMLGVSQQPRPHQKAA